MYFGERLKKEREKRAWSQVELAEKIYVSRQSVSKWETGKNYPSIEVIINLSDLFNITIDELLRSDDKLTEKVIQDSKQQFGWGSYLLSGVGVLLGIIVVSLIKNNGLNWISIGRGIGAAIFIYLICLFFYKGSKRVEQNS